jgi:hypothetical protein
LIESILCVVLILEIHTHGSDFETGTGKDYRT